MNGPDSATSVPRWVRLWCVELPRRLDPWSPTLADAMADGTWTSVWPRVAAYAPWLGLAAGFLAPGLLGVRFVYTESLVFMGGGVAAGVLSGPAGVMIVGGYMARTLLSHDVASGLDAALTRGGALLITYLLLGVLVVLLPSLARAMAEDVMARLRPVTRFFERGSDAAGRVFRVAARAVLFGFAVGGLVWIWCQAMAVMVRPVFTWQGGSPDPTAIRPLQEQWSWLVAAGAVAAVARIVLGCAVAPSREIARRVHALRELRRTEWHARGRKWSRLPTTARLAVTTSVVAFVLSGMYEQWYDPIVVVLAFGVIGVLAERRDRRSSARWTRALRRVPAILRFAVALAVGYVLAFAVLTVLWEGESLRAVLLAAFGTFASLYLLFPASEVRTTEWTAR